MYLNRGATKQKNSWRLGILVIVWIVLYISGWISSK
jgi:hypothetical protein